jgi:hypothetical protein
MAMCNVIECFYGKWKSNVYSTKTRETFGGSIKIDFKSSHAGQASGKATVYLDYDDYTIQSLVIPTEYAFVLDREGNEKWNFRSASLTVTQMFYFTITKNKNTMFQSFYSCITPVDYGTLTLEPEYSIHPAFANYISTKENSKKEEIVIATFQNLLNSKI